MNILNEETWKLCSISYIKDKGGIDLLPSYAPYLPWLRGSGATWVTDKAGIMATREWIKHRKRSDRIMKYLIKKVGARKFCEAMTGYGDDPLREIVDMERLAKIEGVEICQFRKL